MLIGLFAIFAGFDYSKLSKNWFLKSLTFSSFLGGQFGPVCTGQFEPAKGGQFKPARVVNLNRILQIVSIGKIKEMQVLKIR